MKFKRENKKGERKKVEEQRIIAKCDNFMYTITFFHVLKIL